MEFTWLCWASVPEDYLHLGASCPVLWACEVHAHTVAIIYYKILSYDNYA